VSNSVVLQFRAEGTKPNFNFLLFIFSKKPGSGSGERISNSHPSAIPVRNLAIAYPPKDGSPVRFNIRTKQKEFLYLIL